MFEICLFEKFCIEEEGKCEMFFFFFFCFQPYRLGERRYKENENNFENNIRVV